MIVAIAASPSVDVLYVVPELRLGRIHRPVAVHRVAGGKGFNAARTAHALGADVVAAGIVGGATGEWIRQALQHDGVPHALVIGDGATRTSVSVEARDGSGLTEFYEPAAAVTPHEWLELERVVGESLTRGGWLTLSGSLPPGAPLDAPGRLVRLAHDRGASVAVDTYGPALASALTAGPDLVKVNHHEAAAHLGDPDPARGDHAHDDAVLAAAARAALHLLGSSPLAIVTCGLRGSVAAASGSSAPMIATLDATGRYPVGSGDAFLGGLVAALDHGRELPDALRQATAAGAANAALPGAGVLDPDRVRVLVGEVRLTDVDAPVNP